MKIRVPIMITLLTFPLGAQEAVQATAPPEKAKAQVAAKQEARQRAPQRRVTPPSSSERSIPSVRVPPPNAGNPSRTGRATTRPVPGLRAVPSSRAGTSSPEKANVLTENVTIHLQGSVHGAEPLDVSLTGVGPTFQADMVMGEDLTILSHRYTVKPEGDRYRVEYSIGFRIKMVSSRKGPAGPMTNVEFGEVTVTGTAMAKEGERVVISKNGARELGLTLSKAAKK